MDQTDLVMGTQFDCSPVKFYIRDSRVILNKEKITKFVISIWFENLLFLSFKVNKINDHPILTIITPQTFNFSLVEAPF